MLSKAPTSYVTVVMLCSGFFFGYTVRKASFAYNQSSQQQEVPSASFFSRVQTSNSAVDMICSNEIDESHLFESTALDSASN